MSALVIHISTWKLSLSHHSNVVLIQMLYMSINFGDQNSTYFQDDQDQRCSYIRRLTLKNNIKLNIRNIPNSQDQNANFT